MKLLAVGDLHLGRSPGSLPEDLRADRRSLGPAGAWERLVRHALASGVDVVALAGDVVEQENDFFEAYRELDKGIEELLCANIEVVAVAGNHDVQVLPRLAKQLDGFRLLGDGGRWEQRTIESGDEQITLHGWSFPRRAVSSSPLAGHRFERSPGINLGLLHCDRDQRRSDYAPVSTAELEDADLDGWLLGHIHRPDALRKEAPRGYLGSVTGLDPGEHGPRGPWLVSVAGGRLESIEQWKIAPLHWERISIGVGGISAAEDARELLLARVGELDQMLRRHTEPPRAAGLRIALTGRCRLRAELERLFSEEDLTDVGAGGSGIRYFVEELKVVTEPERDLETLAKLSNPPGLLARRLRLLERPAGDSERQALIERARERLAERHAGTHWQPLGALPPDDATIAEWLREAGFAALDALLDQRRDEA